MNNDRQRVMYWGRSWGKAQYYKAARELAGKAMPRNPHEDYTSVGSAKQITEIAIDECKEVTEEDYEKIKEWAEKWQGKPTDKP